MKIRNKICMSPALATISVMVFSSCDSTETDVYISNTVGQQYSDLFVSNTTINWDVYVRINGIDVGLVEVGETVGPFKIDDTKVKIEQFEPDRDCQDKSIYTYWSGLRYCVSNDEAKVQEIKDNPPNIPLFNKEWTWEIGYGEEVN